MPMRSAEAIDRATVSLPSQSKLPRARFAIEVQPDRDREALAKELATRLGPLVVQTELLAPHRDDILLMVLPQRGMRGEPDLAFAAAYALAQDFDLDLVEPDVPTDLMPVPEPHREGGNDESIDSFPPGCWQPAEAGLADNWALELIAAPAAWAFSQQQGRTGEGGGIIVAQLDTGVARHPEVDDIDRAAGFNLIDASTPLDPSDPMNYHGNPGHGTSTASALASPRDHRVVGSAPSVLHMPIRCIESVSRLSQVSVAQGIELAIDQGAHVITMSLGGIPSFSLHRALRRAVAANVIVLAAAGNCVREVVFPARYTDCIAVGGVDRALAMWPGSCRGPEVDISAPAQNVYVAKFDKARQAIVQQGQGTSFAVALTAGVAALWLAHHGRAFLIAQAKARGETLQTMFRRLLRASAKRPDGWDGTRLGAGVVDALHLLKLDIDTGRGDESVVDLTTKDDAVGHIKRYVVAATGDAKVAAAPLPWELYGPELILALATKEKGAAPPSRLESPGTIEQPPLSNELAALAAANPALACALSIQKLPAGG